MKFIGITGSVVDSNNQHICSSNSGKDTLASALVRQKLYQGYDVIVKPLASTLVDIAVKSTGINRIFFTEQAYKNKSLSQLGNKSPRQVLINIGSELRSQYGDDVLARVLMSKYKDSNLLIIVPDVRTIAEVTFMRNIGKVYHLSRYTGMSKTAFLNSIGLKSIDSFTESPLPFCDKDVRVSIDFTNSEPCIMYDNPLQIAA